MGASSIQDYGSVSWDLCEVERDFAERDRKGGLDVGLFIFLATADIHDKRLLSLDDGIHNLVQRDKFWRYSGLLLRELRISGWICSRFRWIEEQPKQDSE